MMHRANALVLALIGISIAAAYVASSRVGAPEEQGAFFDRPVLMISRPTPGATALTDQPPVTVSVLPRRVAQSALVPEEELHRVLSLPGDRALLATALQLELQRVGCYEREINGFWTTSSRMAMQMFLERVNAALPIDEPDVVLLRLVQAHSGAACGRTCPAGQGLVHSGQCLPNALLTTKSKPQGAMVAEGSNPIVTSSLPASTKQRTGPEDRPIASERNISVRQSTSKPEKLVRTFLRTVQRDMAQLGLR
jgi:hypothetical protein